MNQVKSHTYRPSLSSKDLRDGILFVFLIGTIIFTVVFTISIVHGWNTHQTRYAQGVSAFADQLNMEYIGSVRNDPASHMMQADGVIYSFECRTVGETIVCSDPVRYATGEVMQ